MLHLFAPWQKGRTVSAEAREEDGAADRVPLVLHDRLEDGRLEQIVAATVVHVVHRSLLRRLAHGCHTVPYQCYHTTLAGHLQEVGKRYHVAAIVRFALVPIGALRAAARGPDLQQLQAVRRHRVHTSRGCSPDWDEAGFAVDRASAGEQAAAVVAVEHGWPLFREWQRDPNARAHC